MKPTFDISRHQQYEKVRDYCGDIKRFLTDVSRNIDEHESELLSSLCDALLIFFETKIDNQLLRVNPSINNELSLITHLSKELTKLHATLEVMSVPFMRETESYSEDTDVIGDIRRAMVETLGYAEKAHTIASEIAQTLSSKI